MNHSDSTQNNISVVIPVYNSEDTLDELISRLNQVLPAISQTYETILVNDGSSDQSWSTITRLSQDKPGVRGINLMRNYGQHNALLCGVRAAQYEIIVTLDDDLQHPPEEIGKLLPPLGRGYDVVYGTPARQQHPFWRNLSSYITRLALQSAMGVKNAQKVSAFRAFRTCVRDAFSDFRSPFVILDVLLAWGTNRFYTVPVTHDPRHDGKSNYTFRKLVRHAINMATGFTVVPLQLASMMGFAFALFGLLILIYVVARFIIQGGSIPGFPFLASIVAIFSGVQLFSLGIIGEYLARMHFRLMGKPSYVIRSQEDQFEETNDRGN